MHSQNTIHWKSPKLSNPNSTIDKLIHKNYKTYTLGIFLNKSTGNRYWTAGKAAGKRHEESGLPLGSGGSRVLGFSGLTGRGFEGFWVRASRVFAGNPQEPLEITPDFTTEGSGHTGSPGFVGLHTRVAGLGFTDHRFSSGHRQPSSPRQKTWRIGPPATLGSSGFQVFPARQIPPSISHSQLPKSHSLSLSFSLCCSGRRRKNEEEKKNREGEVERRRTSSRGLLSTEEK
jgi:hypothetical protein